MRDDLASRDMNSLLFEKALEVLKTTGRIGLIKIDSVSNAALYLERKIEYAKRSDALKEVEG